MEEKRPLYTGYFVVYALCAVAYYAVLSAESGFAQLNPSLAISALSFGLAPAFFAVVAIDRWLWRVPGLRSILGIQTPVLKGRWTGHLKSSFSQNQREHEVVLEIHQTLSSIDVIYYDVNAVTTSIAATISRSTRGGPFKLYVLYHNTPITTKYADLQGHSGVMDLHIDAPATNLFGTYFNNPFQRNTYGEMRMTFRNRKPIGRFIDGVHITTETPSISDAT